MIRRLLLGLVCVLLAARSAGAAAVEYFVDFDATPGTGCSDSGPGSDPRAGGTPWCTLPGTRDTSNVDFLSGPWVRIHAGDTISIKAGTTHTSADDGGLVFVDPSHYDSGTAAQRIVIRKHPTWGEGAYASLNGTGMTAPQAGIVTDFDVDYVTFDGVEIYESPDFGIQIDHDAHHVTIDHAYVHDGHTTSALVYISGCTTDPCMQIVRNSIVANCQFGGGILIYDNPGGHVLVENNVVHHICGGAGNYDGIQCGERDGSTNYCAFVGNLVYAHGDHSGYPGCPHAGSDPIDVGGDGCHHDDLVDGNVVYDAGGSLKVHGTYEDDCTGPLESYNIVRRNRLTNLEIVSYSFPNDTIFYNNTQYNPDTKVNVQIFSTEPDSPPGTSSGTPAYAPRALAVGRDVDFARLTFKNNIMWGQTSYHVQVNGVAGYRQDVRYSSMRFYGDLYSAFHNAIWYPDETAQDPSFYGSWPSYLASRNTDPPDTDSLLSAAPQSAVFVDAANRDYRLAPGSPAIDAGVPITRAVGASAANGSVDLAVERASFVDGYDGLFEPDHITVGDCPDVAIAGVDDVNATMVLASPCRWHDGDPVNLAYQGSAPDIGAFEFAPAPTPTPGNPTPTPASSDTDASTSTPLLTSTPIPTVTSTPTSGEERTCPATPLVGCRQPIASRKASIQLDVHTSNHAKDRLLWTWTHGPVTAKSEFGDPLTTDGYLLCVYDGTGFVLAAPIPAGGLCAGKPCWKERKTGFGYRNRPLTPYGVAKLDLKDGLKPGKAAIAFRGTGTLLALPSPQSLSSPIHAQLLRADGPCWEGVFSAPFLKQDAKRLKDASD